MPKGFKLIDKVQDREAMLRRIVCEVRYQDGQLYLDRCGRLLKTILSASPEWVVAPDPTPQGTTVYNIVTGTQLGVSINNASLSLDKSSTDELIDSDEKRDYLEQAESLLELIRDELEAKEYGRIGYRETFYFPFESKKESEQWLTDLGILTVNKRFYEAFQSNPDALGVAITMEAESCRYRIWLNGVERAAQIPVGDNLLTVRPDAATTRQKGAFAQAMKKKRHRQINSTFAVVLDIDAFLLDPPDVNLGDFIREHAANNLRAFQAAVTKRQ
jgi:hypothetical protein